MSGTPGRGSGVAPRTQAHWFASQAREAFERGERAFADGDWADAVRWLGRAHRIAPDDPAGTLALASAMLRADDSGAAALFEAVAARTDLREAWLGLAAARHASARHAEAARALNTALTRCVIPSGLAADALFTAIARLAGAPGWCCVGEGFQLRHAVADGGAPVLRGDGRPQKDGALAAGVRVVTAHRDGRPLLGSPLALGHMRRVEGFVEIRDGALAGWAWHPAAPDEPPELTVGPAAGGPALRLRAEVEVAGASGGTTRHRVFRVGADRLAAMPAPWRVGPAKGGNLLGSPIDLRDPICARTGEPSPAGASTIAPRGCAADPDRAVVVVIPVYRGRAVTLACLDAVEATVPAGSVVVVVDDATPEPALAAALDRRHARRRVQLVRHEANRGFPASANAGLRTALALPGARDVVLLNSDTWPTPGWLERLRSAVHADGAIGTATPLSNDATILGYPHPDSPGAMPARRAARRLGRLAARANPSEAVDIPTAIGFCMYIRRECLDAVGLLRDDVFAQGYGEENDFCCRAGRIGWRHVAVPGAYVAHAGGASFGAARTDLIARNLTVLERLHPGYHAAIAAFVARDPLATARRRLDLLRFAAGRARAGAVVVVTHDSGGGVERVVRARCAAIRADGRRPILLKPVVDPASKGERRYRPGLCALGDDTEETYPNLVHHLPGGREDLIALLRQQRPVSIEIHHMLGHDPSLLTLAEALGVPQDVHVHDYAAFCPRITLLGPAARYCGEPVDPAVCDACVAEAGSLIEEDIPAATLRTRSARHLAAARRVVVPSNDAATRMRRHFPTLRPIAVPHEDDATPPQPASRRSGDGDRIVCVVGAIGREKGYDVLLACARDAAVRRLALAFVVVGHTIDDAALIDSGRVFVTGPYREAEAEELIRAQGAAIAFLPSIWPETWCFTLGHAWRAGLHVVAFDIGAPAERIRNTGRGTLIPLGLRSLTINEALLAVASMAREECGDPPAGPTRVRA